MHGTVFTHGPVSVEWLTCSANIFRSSSIRSNSSASGRNTKPRANPHMATAISVHFPSMMLLQGPFGLTTILPFPRLLDRLAASLCEFQYVKLLSDRSDVRSGRAPSLLSSRERWDISNFLYSSFPVLTRTRADGANLCTMNGWYKP
jgi:hypothetical protein